MKALPILIVFHLSGLFLLALPANPFAGFPVPDSLQVKLNSSQGEKKIDILNDITFYLSDKIPQRTIPIAQKILYWADSLQYPKGLFDATNNLGILFFRTAQYTQAIACFNECIALAQKINDEGRQAAAISNMALVYTELTQYQKALQLHLKAMKIRQQRNDTLSIAQSLNNIGMTYHARGDWNVALSYYQKAVQMLENTPYKIALANTYNNIGQLYFSSFSDTTSYLADSAEIYFMKAYTRFSTDDNRVGIIKTLINLGNLYASKGLSEKAIDAYRAALNQQNLIADSAGKALTLFNMGILFDEMGETKRAREYLLQSLKIAENFNLGDLRRENYQQLFHLAHKENRLQEATLYASLFFAINDSLNDLSKKLLIDQFQGKFNYLDIENSQLASNLKKWQKIGIFATGIIVLSLLFLIWRRKKK